jgi:hypothetical protein
MEYEDNDTNVVRIYLLSALIWIIFAAPFILAFLVGYMVGRHGLPFTHLFI